MLNILVLVIRGGIGWEWVGVLQRLIELPLKKPVNESSELYSGG